MGLATVVLSFFAVMIAREFKRQHRQWPYLVAGLLLVMLFVARIYLGLEWFSGALLGLLLGLAWVSIVGIAYRQRRKEPFSGAVAANIFYAALLFLFVWQVSKNNENDVARLQSPIVKQEMAAERWWAGGWEDLPPERTVLGSAAAGRFNFQVASSLGSLEAALTQQGWESVEPADWRWLIRALNPDADESSLPLIPRSFQGLSEELLLRQNLGEPGRLRAIRFWDSGIRLMPENTVVYLVLVSEEQLVQRFRFFSYWRSVPLTENQVPAADQLFPGLEGIQTGSDLMLLREKP